MPSLKTFYRAIVMVAAGVIVVKGWQLYGPTTEQTKSLAVRGIEMVSSAWGQSQSSTPAVEQVDPRLAIAPMAPPPASLVEPAPLFAAETSEAQSVHEIGAAVEAAAVVPAAAEISETAALPSGVADRLPPLYSRLEALGVTDPQLEPWGATGQMYRFCCRASFAADTPAFARHFEAVAAEPVAAVEQVVAKVEDWRAMQRDVP